MHVNQKSDDDEPIDVILLLYNAFCGYFYLALLAVK